MFTSITHLQATRISSFEETYLYEFNDDAEMQEEVDEFLDTYNIHVRRCDQDDTGWSVLIRDKVSKEEFWIDVWPGYEEDGEMYLKMDWNQIMFFRLNTRDMARKAVMNDPRFAQDCFNMAESYVTENYLS